MHEMQKDSTERNIIALNAYFIGKKSKTSNFRN